MEFQDRDWIELVKRTREKFNIGLDDAHDVILADGEMRRLLASRVNRGRCRTLALRDLRLKGERSCSVREGEHIRFKDSQPR